MQKTEKQKTHPMVWLGLLVVIFLSILYWGHTNYDPAQHQLEESIKLCEKHLADPLIPDGSKITIVKPACDKFKDEYKRKYGY